MMAREVRLDCDEDVASEIPLVRAVTTGIARNRRFSTNTTDTHWLALAAQDGQGRGLPLQYQQTVVLG